MAAAVVLLHTLRARRRPQVVSSLFLWERVQKELASDHRRRKLVKTLLLFLQLLTVLLLAGALAEPVRRSSGRAPVHVGIIVDTSASMAVGEPESRLARARERLEAFFSQGEADRYILWTTTGALLHYDGQAKEELLDALSGLPAPAGTSDWERLHQQVAAGVRDEVPLHVIVATDGAVDASRVAPLRFAHPLVHVYLLDVGQAAENLAVTGFSARPSGRGQGHHQVLVQVENFGGRAASTLLQVTARLPEDEPAGAPGTGSSDGGETPVGTLVYATRLELAPGASQRVFFEHWFLPGQVLTAEIEGRDAFPVDDVAHLTANPADATRVLLVGEENRFLTQGLLSFPQVEVTHSFDPLTAVGAGASFDLVIFYGETLPEEFSGTALVFEGDAGTASEPAEITWWDRRHPVSRFVDWQLVSAGWVRPLTPGPAESVLLESSAGPLITLLEEEGRRILRVGISLEQSDFPFRVAFPVFLQNVLDWAKPEGQSAVPPATRPGELPPAVAAAWSEAGALTLTLPTGDTVELGAATDGRGDVATLLARPGVYAWRAGRDEGRFALSLLDPEESDLAPRLVEPMAERGVFLVDQYGPYLSDLPIEGLWEEGASPGLDARFEGAWEWVALAALALLLVEGRLYTARQAKRSSGTGPLTGPRARERRLAFRLRRAAQPIPLADRRGGNSR